MKFIISLTIILLCRFLAAQPFQMGHVTLSLTDPSRNNRSIPTEVYYPADVAGNNVPLYTASSTKFPVLSFGHGFVMTWDAYENIWSAVVPEGYIIAFPKTEGTTSPSHAEFGKDLSFVIRRMLELGEINSSIFYGRVDTMTAVMGHSMGGGAAFLAAQNSPQIKTLATLAPAETNPSAVQAARAVSLPALVFAGANDCITPIAAHQGPMYDSLKSDCKLFINIQGGSHCQMADDNFLCDLGEATCSPAPAISRAAQHTVINRYLLPWLDYQLKNDCQSASAISSTLLSDASVSYKSTCASCNITATSDVLFASSQPVSFFTTDGNVVIRFPQMTSDKWAVQLFPITGQQILNGQFSTQGESEILMPVAATVSPGLYFLHLSSQDKSFVVRLLKTKG